mgnify:CR=1 FL=1
MLFTNFIKQNSSQHKLFIYQYSDSFDFGGVVIATLNYDLRMGTGTVPNARAKIINVNAARNMIAMKKFLIKNC